MKNGFVLWFTGLSGAGKTTIAHELGNILKNYGMRVEILDGDILRENFSKDLSFSKEDRDLNVQRTAFIAKLLARNGVITLVSLISPYKDSRQRAKKEINDFYEIYVKCPIEICMARDVKGLYKRALSGSIPNFTGITDVYEEPDSPDLVLETNKYDIEKTVNILLEFLEDRNLIPKSNLKNFRKKKIVLKMEMYTLKMLKPLDKEVLITEIINSCAATLSKRVKHIINYDFYGNINLMKDYIQTNGSLHFNSDEGVSKYTESSGKHPYTKLIGIIQMIELIEKSVANFTSSIGVDFLGGSGQLERVIKSYIGQQIEGFITADISSKQLLEGIKKGGSMIPCDVSNPLTLKDNVLDWGIIAYGFHHIAPEKRLITLDAVFSKIKNGGVLLLHDGFIGGSTVDIMSKIVDVYSIEKHPFPYVSIEDFEIYQNYFIEQYGARVEKYSIFDPMIFFGSDVPTLIHEFSTYMINHYYLQLNVEETYEIFKKTLHEYLLKEYNEEQVVYLRKEEENLTTMSARIVFNKDNTRNQYAKELYVGKCPAEIKEVYDKVIKTSDLCVIVPRFAVVLCIHKNN